MLRYRINILILYIIYYCVLIVCYLVFFAYLSYISPAAQPPGFGPLAVYYGLVDIHMYVYICKCVYISIVKYPYIWGFIVYLLARPASSLVAASALQPLAISP